jgi:hypothetical protein
MSVKIMSLVWEHYPVGGGELLTALAYADHAHDDGAGVRPSIEHMARKTRQSERTIQMHVAAMRRTTWLITVRHAGGGRGRTTEYRINPAWIANPAGFAPFLAIPQTVQFSATKGAGDSAKGCKAFAPQPPRTIIEPTTTEEQPGVVVDATLRFPQALEQGEVQCSAGRLLARCPAELRQTVLDEVAGLADRGVVRHPLGLLRRLVELAGKGEFVPAAAIDHRKKLDRARAEQEHQAAEEADRCHRSTPEAIEASRRARDEALIKLGRRPRLPSVAAGSAAEGAERSFLLQETHAASK